MSAAYDVLVSAGFNVTLPKQHLCCGRPLYDFGMLDTAKEYLLKVLDALAPQLAAGTPIVVLEPSCASVFRDELPNLLPNDPRSAKLSSQTLLLSEFLVKHAPHYRPPQIEKKIIVHGHCHHRSTMGMHDEMKILRATGADVELLDSGCCGMAGPFGFEKDKFDRLADTGRTRSSSRHPPRSRSIHHRQRRLQLLRTGHAESPTPPLHLAEVLSQKD